MIRVETGPVQFGDEDWPGIFIRGDEAFGHAASLRYWAEHPAIDARSRIELLALAVLLESHDVNGKRAAAPIADMRGRR